MAITPQHQKGEPGPTELEKAYNRARSIGLFLVEKYAREVMRADPQFVEFVVDREGETYFIAATGGVVYPRCLDDHTLVDFLHEWDEVLGLTSEPMRFTADGPMRREW
jgi:hypothetical protein